MRGRAEDTTVLCVVVCSGTPLRTERPVAIVYDDVIALKHWVAAPLAVAFFTDAVDAFLASVHYITCLIVTIAAFGSPNDAFSDCSFFHAIRTALSVGL